MAIKAKKKEDILQLLDYQIERYLTNTETVDFYAVKVKQNQDANMYTTSLATSFSHSLICRLPRDMQNQAGIQRALNGNKVNGITNKFENEVGYTSPNSVVINLKNNSRDEVSRFLSIVYPVKNSDELILIKIDLRGYREFIANSAIDEEGYLLEPEKVMMGILVDGHHRTEGAYNANELDFQFPVSVYIDLPYREMARVFTNINEYQEKPSPTHTLAVKAIAGVLEDIDKKGYEYLTQLNNEENFVLNNRIRMFDGKRPKDLPTVFINGKSMHTLLVKHIIPKLNNYSILTGVSIVNSYFEAWKDLYPDAWGDKEHVLTKAMGITLVSRIFPEIFTIASLNERTSRLNKDIFKRYIENIFKDKEIILAGNNVILDWKSETFGGYSSGKGINEIFALLEQLVNNYRDSMVRH